MTESFVDEVCKFYGIKNYTILADLLDLSQPTISQWVKRDSLGTAVQNIIKYICKQDKKFSLDEFFFSQRSFTDDFAEENVKNLPDPILIKIFAENKNVIVELLAKEFVKELLKNQILQKEYSFEYALILKLEKEKDEFLNWALNNVSVNNGIPEYLNQNAYSIDKILWRERVSSYCLLEAEQRKDDDYMNYLYVTMREKLDSIEIRQANIIIASVDFSSLLP